MPEAGLRAGTEHKTLGGGRKRGHDVKFVYFFFRDAVEGVGGKGQTIASFVRIHERLMLFWHGEKLRDWSALFIRST